VGGSELGTWVLTPAPPLLHVLAVPLSSTYGVRGYPTLLYFKPGGKDHIKYSEARELAALTNFLKQQAA
jgi:hypothetical protein